MAKKSSTNRQRSASHAKGSATSKTQPATRQASAATLVRASKPDSAEQDSTTPTSGAETPSKPSAASIVRDTPAAVPVKSTAKPATPAKATPTPTAKTTTPVAPALKPAPAASKRQGAQVARARATQRARQAGMISAENYSYVLGDLKLVLGLAIGAFAILIALTFILPR